MRFVKQFLAVLAVLAACAAGMPISPSTAAPSAGPRPPALFTRTFS
ncbi:hypothetical protein ACFW2X_27920 [Streptomyces antibioticus]